MRLQLLEDINDKGRDTYHPLTAEQKAEIQGIPRTQLQEDLYESVTGRSVVPYHRSKSLKGDRD